ncbi:MAG: hypothetical protein WCR80_06845 [Bacilli bacterium]
MSKKFYNLNYGEVSPSTPPIIDIEPEEMILEEEIIEEKKIIKKEISVSPLGEIETISTQAPGTVLSAIQYATSSIIAAPISMSTKYIAEGADFLGDTVLSVLDYVGDTVSGIGSKIDSSSSLGAALSSILSIIGTNISSDYSKGEVGISNTTFGNLMSDSWYGTDKSFLNYFSKNKKTYKINILNSTPLDSGNERTSLYGSMMLGVPFLFNSVSDPGNRTLLNSLIKDARFLSLTPGLPKYNGGVYTQANSESIFKQTTTPNEMLSFLLKNGLDKNFSLKDKRYYTFESKYDDYFSYLETMLIPI